MARPCPISESQFSEFAKDIVLTGEHDGQQIAIVLTPSMKDGKSLGWNAGSIRMSMKIGGVQVPIIGSCNLSCIGSKGRE
jgi:hypothetical protein